MVLDYVFCLEGCGLVRRVGVFGYVLNGSIWARLCQIRLMVGQQGHVTGARLCFKWNFQKAKGILPVFSVELACMQY